MKVRIYKPHTHAGQDYKPGPEGIEIDVDEASAKFIRLMGVDKKPPAEAANDPVAPAAPR